MEDHLDTLRDRDACNSGENRTGSRLLILTTDQKVGGSSPSERAESVSKFRHPDAGEFFDAVGVFVEVGRERHEVEP